MEIYPITIIPRAVATVAEQVAAAVSLLMAGLGRQSWPATLPAWCAGGAS